MSAEHPGRPEDDGFPLVEADNPEYWRALNEMGKRGELPERIWPKRSNGTQVLDSWTPKRKSLLGE